MPSLPDNLPPPTWSDEKYGIALYCGDCLDIMPGLPKVDCVVADPPYGTTACKWDSVIPLDHMWGQLNRIIKPSAVIVMMASQPFTTTLISSNMKMFKYCWVWEKSKGLNFVHAKNMPLKFIEDICVFSKAPIGHKVQLGNRRMTYNPQGLEKVDKKWSRPKKYESGHGLKRDSHKLDRVIEFSNYPNSLLKISNSDNRERGAHPTQKPVALMKYLIKTYSNEGETVLDFTMGSGTTGVAAVNLGRAFIGIDNDRGYFDIAVERIRKAIIEKQDGPLFAERVPEPMLWEDEDAQTNAKKNTTSI